MRVAPIAVAVLIAIAASGAAQPAPVADPSEAGFRAAEARLTAGDVRGAVDAFVAVADRTPASIWADDALAEAARAAETSGQLERAVALWRRIADVYPDSRQARRAQARLAELVAMIGAHGEWAQVAADEQAILRAAAGHRDPPEEIRRMEALVRAHPDYPHAGAARIWIGDAWGRRGDLEQAATWYEEAARLSHAPIDRWRARKASADLMVARGDFGDAEELYAGLRQSAGGAMERAAIDAARRELASRRARWRLELGALGLLGVLAALAIGFARRDAGSWRAAARGLARPPLEVWFAAPFALALTGLAWRNDSTVGAAVASIAAGGLAVAWLSGATLGLAGARRGRIGAVRAIAQAGLAGLAVLAIAYVVLARGTLVDMLVETWRNGHDR